MTFGLRALLAAMSPEASAAISAVAVFCTTVFTSVFAWWSHRSNVEVKQVVKSESATQREAILKVERIVDGPLSKALEVNAQVTKENFELKRRVAELTMSTVDQDAVPESEKKAQDAEAIDRNRKEGKALPPVPPDPTGQKTP